MSTELVGTKKVVDPETGEIFEVRESVLKASQAVPIYKISTGTINSMLLCGRQYQFRTIGHIYPPMAPMYIVSRVAHITLKEFFTDQVRTRRLSADDLGDLFEFNWVKQIENADINWAKNPERSPSDWMKLGVTLLNMYGRDFVPKITPKAVDIPFAYPLDDTDYTIMSRIDLEAEVEDTEGSSATGTVLIDFKISGRKMSEGEALKNLDAHAAAMFYFTEDGRRSRPVAYHFHQGVDNKTPVWNVIKTERTRFHVDWYKEQVRTVIRQIEAGIFTPNTASFVCGKDSCGYWEMCQGAEAQGVYARCAGKGSTTSQMIELP